MNLKDSKRILHQMIDKISSQEVIDQLLTIVSKILRNQ